MEKILTREETREKALRLLEFRSHSEKELRVKLIRAGAPDEAIDETVDFLLEYGFLDDQKYAIAKAQDLAKLKKFGKRRIYSELVSKGIALEYIEEALSLLEDDEEETLLPLVEKKLRGDFDRKSTERAIRYFAYRGYNIGDIKRCIETLKAQEQEE